MAAKNKDVVEVIIERLLNNQPIIYEKEVYLLLNTHIDFQVDWNVKKVHLLKLRTQLDIIFE